ncbi:chemotaxis protein CheX [Phosphitispora sp. TUW77]|uniref:chemotaxis protein CheX n=1 Tax=Phosphitispora sp. TUW77 TaxID=3152361 RepID=UPI003AB56736
MKAEIINPFLVSAKEILEMETGLTGIRGKLSLASSKWTTQEITVIINIIGDVKGTFLIGTPIRTAINLVEIMLRDSIDSFNDIVISGIAELSNIIAGRALVNLEKIGYNSDITPPMLLYGQKANISTLKRRRIQIPLKTDIGLIELSIALED